MDFMLNVIYNILRYSGMIDESQPIRNNKKRNRDYEDFSSDDEIPLLGYREEKRLRLSDFLEKSDSSKKTVPVCCPGLSRNEPTELLEEEPAVAWIQSKSEKTPKSQLALDFNDADRDDSQHDDDEVATPPNIPLDHFTKTSLDATYNDDDALLNTLEAMRSNRNLDYEEMLRRVTNTIKKLYGKDSKHTVDATLFKLPQVDNELNADRHQIAHTNDAPIRVSSTMTSDSDEELLLPEYSRKSSLKQYSRVLDSKCNNLQYTQEKVKDTRPAVDITSKSNSDQNIVCSHIDNKTESSQHMQLESDTIEQPHNKSEIQKTRNDVRMWSDITQKEAGSSRTENIENFPEELHTKFFVSNTLTNLTGSMDLHESKMNSEKNESQSHKCTPAADRLSKLESEYITGDTDHYLRSTSNIVSKMNDEQFDSISLDCKPSSDSLLKLESKHNPDLLNKQEKLDNALQESDITQKVDREEKEDGWGLPAATKKWLLKLTKDKCGAENNQKSLSNTPQELNNELKENHEQSKAHSHKEQTTDVWLAVESEYNVRQHMWKINLNDVSSEPHKIPKADGEQNAALSNMSDTIKKRSSYLHSKRITKLPKTYDKPNDDHQEVSDSSKAKSYLKHASEDWRLKLSSLYNRLKQEAKTNHTQRQKLSKLESGESAEEIQVLRKLSLEEEIFVDIALIPEPEDEMIAERFKMRIHRRDLKTLSHFNWLNDEVINYYMNLIMQRSKLSQMPKVYATNTFFYPKLMQSGQAGLRRWTRKIDIFSYDIFLIPVNIDDHWCLSVIDFQSRIIKYLDSRLKTNQEILDALMQYLKDEHQDKKGVPFDDSGWKTECLKDIPLQTNGCDCGMFALTFAEFSSRYAPYSFTQADMPYLRRKAVLEILVGLLLPSLLKVVNLSPLKDRSSITSVIGEEKCSEIDYE